MNLTAVASQLELKLNLDHAMVVHCLYLCIAGANLPEVVNQLDLPVNLTGLVNTDVSRAISDVADGLGKPCSSICHQLTIGGACRVS